MKAESYTTNVETQIDPAVIRPPATNRQVGVVTRLVSGGAWRQLAVLTATIAVFVVLAGVVAFETPPWEANDEPDHFLNAATIAQGRMYRMEPGAGLEPHQPPLYYAILAAEMRFLDLDRTRPEVVLAPGAAPQALLFVHSVATDAADERRVVPLRLTSIVFGVITVVSAFALTRLLTDDPWSPVLAALVVAFVPKFAFLSGVINNDSLATALASVATVLIALYVGPRHGERRNAALLITAGVVLGLGLLAKLTVAPVAIVLVLAVGMWSEDRLRALAMVLLPMTFVFAPWAVHNTIAYGDPLLLSTAKEYLREIRPGVILESPTLRRLVVELPQGIWKSFWYTSGWNQVRFVWYFYLPLWVLTAVGIGGLIPRWSRRNSAQKRVAVLAIGVGLAGLSNVWLVGLQTTQPQARIAFVGLIAIAGLVAVGYEWIRWPPLRFGLPIASLLALVNAVMYHVLPLSD